MYVMGSRFDYCQPVSRLGADRLPEFTMRKLITLVAVAALSAATEPRQR